MAPDIPSLQLQPLAKGVEPLNAIEQVRIHPETQQNALWWTRRREPEG